MHDPVRPAPARVAGDDLAALPADPIPDRVVLGGVYFRSSWTADGDLVLDHPDGLPRFLRPWKGPGEYLVVDGHRRPTFDSLGRRPLVVQVLGQVVEDATHSVVVDLRSVT